MGTHYKGNDEEVLALNAWIKLARANKSVFKNIKPSMVRYNLTTTQFAVLESLLHLGSMSQNQLSAKILRSSGNIVKVIDNLERDGLVIREASTKDRRAKIVSLTIKGKTIISIIFPDHIKSIIKTLSILNEKEQLELGRLCKKLGLGLEYIDK
jgi:MarR family 2-MHQ and catechol resistance regulon transcriptional repressor